MLKKFAIAAACAALTFTAAGATAQDKPQEKPKETTIVIKDDATPKAKAAAKKTKEAAKKAADAVKDTKVVVKDDTTPTKVVVKDDTTPKVKKAADAVKDTKVVVKDDTTPQVKKGVGVMTDAEITSAVKTKLMGDKAVGGLKIDVDTEKGVVTLTGPVRTAAEKAEALRLAKTTKGVSSVVDKLTIQ